MKTLTAIVFGLFLGVMIECGGSLRIVFFGTADLVSTLVVKLEQVQPRKELQ